MSTLRNIAILTVSGALLAACAGPDTKMLASMPNKGTAFDKGLHAGYTELAKIEAAEFDIADADYFASKAKMAAKGTSKKQKSKLAAELNRLQRESRGVRPGQGNFSRVG